jgi:ATP-dependent Clp protease ATP-binding subunit ClpA
VAHKWVLNLAEAVRVAVNLSEGSDERLLGDVYLRVKRDASVCAVLAEEGYDQDLGARSLYNVVKHVIEEELVEAYLDVDGEIRERQPMMDFVVSVVRGEVAISPVWKADVSRKGEDDEEEDFEDDDSE